jgi:hypothetical protein
MWLLANRRHRSKQARSGRSTDAFCHRAGTCRRELSIECGIGVDLSAAAKRALHHGPESGGMRKGSADALRGDGEVSGGGAGSRAEDKLHAGAGGDRERAGRIGNYPARKAIQGDLNAAAEIVLATDGRSEWRACVALCDGQGVGRESDRKIGRHRGRHQRLRGGGAPPPQPARKE